MGCDIHFAVEVSSPPGLLWRVDHIFEHLPRNYADFARLANVRNGAGGPIPISMPRGLPFDVSDEVKAFLDSEDYHSHSWVSGDEFSRAWPWSWDSIKGSDVALVGWASLRAKFYSDQLRFVFAFDN